VAHGSWAWFEQLWHLTGHWLPAQAFRRTARSGASTRAVLPGEAQLRDDHGTFLEDQEARGGPGVSGCGF
jgi:hypothetical protein